MNKKLLIFIFLFILNQSVFAQRIAIATKALGTVEIEKKEKPGFIKLKYSIFRLILNLIFFIANSFNFSFLQNHKFQD